MRVCVIGAGIVGASVAYELAGRDVDVVVVDGAGVGDGATAVSFAWVNANDKRPRDYFELNHAGMREYARLAGELPDTGWLHRGGRLATAEHIPDLEAHVSRLVSWGYPAEMLDARTVAAQLEPGVEFADPDLRIGFFPEEFCVDAVTLTRLLMARAGTRGATGHFGSAVVAMERHGDTSVVRLSDGTTMYADAVVNATGAAAAEVGRLLGSPVPLAPTWGMTAVVHAQGHLVRHVVHTADVEVRPEGVDLLRLHDTTVDALLPDGARDRVELTATLLQRAAGLVPGLASAQVLGTYVGLRPIPADGVSSVGALPSIPGCYEAVTHSGVTLGPLIGRLLATEIVDGTVDRLLRPFRPDRFHER